MKRMISALVLVALIAAATVSFAAVKTYQYTGVVKTVDQGTFSVQKSATDTWTFSTDSATTGTPKIGDKVTVTYRMVATNIEKK